MPRLTTSNPKYQKHRASGQAVVTLNGRDFYLGPHGTQASRDEYDRLIGEWLQNGRRLQRPSAAAPADLTVVELVAAFWGHAQTYYHQPGGHCGELGSIRLALAYLKRLYGRTEAAAFGPLALKTVRQAMVDAGWSRRYVNRQVDRLRRVFRWGAEEEMLSAQVHQALRTVPGLRQGKTQAYEPEPVKPVPEEHVYAIKDFVSRQVWAMVELQMLSGMRPGEVAAMRTGDVDTTGKLWTYKPEMHKTQYRGHERTVYFGPKAQAVLAPFLKPDLQAFIFSPAEAEAERLRKAHAERVTPLSCGNVPGSNRLRAPGRKPGARYSVSSYRRAIAKACVRAFGMPGELREPETEKQKLSRTGEDPKVRRAARQAWNTQHVWHPHQLRHNAATRLRKDYGLEAAQVILGHKTLAVTQVYAEKNVDAARRIMGEVG